MDMHLQKLYLKSGDNVAELEGEHISLADPLVRDLLSRVFSLTNPEDQAKIDALTKSLSASASQLSKSVEEGK